LGLVSWYEGLFGFKELIRGGEIFASNKSGRGDFGSEMDAVCVYKKPIRPEKLED